MSNLVVHFEIHGSDPARLADFYERLLGWSFQQFGDMPYWAIDTGDEAASQGGVGHGINDTALSHAARFLLEALKLPLPK